MATGITNTESCLKNGLLVLTNSNLGGFSLFIQQEWSSSWGGAGGVGCLFSPGDKPERQRAL